MLLLQHTIIIDTLVFYPRINIDKLLLVFRVHSVS